MDWIVLFIVNNHVWLEFRNNDISWEGTSSGREATDIAIEQEVIVSRFYKTIQGWESMFEDGVVAPGISTLM